MTKKEDKKRVEKDIRPEVFFNNYDYVDPKSPAEDKMGPGGGLYHGEMDKYKSVKDFIDQKRKRRNKLKDINNTIAFFRVVNLIKIANNIKLKNTLDEKNISEELQAFILNLPANLQGFAVGKVVKEPNILLPNLISFLDNLNKKPKNKFKIDVPEIYQEWFQIQLNKYPQMQDKIVTEKNNIINFVESYNLQLSSFTAERLFKLMDKENNKSNGEFDQFFNKIKEQEKNKLNVIRATKPFYVWVLSKCLEFRIEWEKKIAKYLQVNHLSFQELLHKEAEKFNQMQQGLLRGIEHEPSPLMHNEHEKLMNKMEELGDWFNDKYSWNQNVSKPLSQLSVPEAIHLSNLWHEEEAKKGNGLKYDPLDSSNIVYGPNNWQDPENNGYFILELKSENDLKVEGCKMNHCVGGYWEFVKDGRGRIFSLRDASNKPILTIEADMSGVIVRQDYGKSNSKQDKRFHDMVNEWIENNEIDYSKLSNIDVFSLLSKNKNVNSTILHILAQNENYNDGIYAFIANYPNTSSKTLDLLGTKKSEGIKYQVALNNNASPYILDILSNNRSNSIKEAVALNPNTSIETLKNLANDPDEHISRKAIYSLEEKKYND